MNKYEFKEEFKDFLQTNSLTQAQICRTLSGVSTGQLSQFLNGGYKGDEANLIEKLKKYMDSFSIKNSLKKDEFELKKTIDIEMANFIVDEALIAKELVVLYGDAGTGKTTFAKAYTNEHPEVKLIELTTGTTIKYLLQQMCEAINIKADITIPETIRKIALAMKTNDIAFMFDEAEHLTVKALETIRRIWDISGYDFPLIFVGTHVLINTFKGSNGELLQLFSRSSGKHEFKGLRYDEKNQIDEFEMFFGEFSNEIRKYTTHLRRAVHLFKKANRLAELGKEKLSANYIKKASSMIFLD